MSNFGQDLAESEDALAKQFDPNDPSYHGGLTTAVPIGGGRVPEGMSELPPEGYTPPPVVDYGPEYDAAMKEREMMNEFKKSLNKIPVAVAVLRKDSANQQAKNGVSNALKELEGYFTLYPQDTENGSLLNGIITKYSDLEAVVAEDKASLLKDECTQLVRIMGRELKDSLAKIKKIKKVAMDKAKAAP